MKPIVILGRGGHALSCLDVIRSTQQFEVIGYVDSVGTLGDLWEGIPFLGSDEDLIEIRKRCSSFFLGLGQIKTPQIRMNLVDRLKNLNADFPRIISPHAYVSSMASVDEGTIIMHGSYVGPRATIGAFNILNTKSIVEHGSSVEDFVHVSTAAVINGDVKVGLGSFIGSNCVLCQGVEVPKGSFVQAGQFIGKKHEWK